MTADQLTLVHDLAGLPDMVVPAAGVRRMTEADLEEVAQLYFEAYEPGEACESLDEARDDVRASFAGDYGDFWWDGSFVHEDPDGPVAAVMTVSQAPWPDTPPGPFIIELFTDRAQRRRHLARDLVELVLVEAAASGHKSVGLRVIADNDPAIALYRGLGFTEFPARPSSGTSS